MAGRLITGNKAHFPSKLCRGVNVLSPGKFLKFFASRRDKGSLQT
jgi:hypothetical protein